MATLTVLSAVQCSARQTYLVRLSKLSRQHLASARCPAASLWFRLKSLNTRNILHTSSRIAQLSHIQPTTNSKTSSWQQRIPQRRSAKWSQRSQCSLSQQREAQITNQWRRFVPLTTKCANSILKSALTANFNLTHHSLTA